MTKMGRPRKTTEQLSLRLETSTISKIDDLRKMEADLPSRPEMIRRMIDGYFNDLEKAEE